MPAAERLRPRTRKVNRSGLRQEQSVVLKMARGRTVVVVASRGKAEEKYILDKPYFEELVAALQAATETLEIMMDGKLYDRLLRAGRTLERDVRSGKLYSLEEAFGER